MDLQDATLDDVEAVIVAKLLEGSDSFLYTLKDMR